MSYKQYAVIAQLIEEIEEGRETGVFIRYIYMSSDIFEEFQEAVKDYYKIEMDINIFHGCLVYEDKEMPENSVYFI